HVCDSPKLNVSFGIMWDRTVGHFFHKRTITSAVFLDVLESFVFPQIAADFDGLHFGALDGRFCGQWIGREGPINWPPPSPDLTPMNFIFWGKSKTLCTAKG
ncbi:hypothetical protein B7P43_G09757, partial [Cryptotermes secundus]